MNKDVKRDPHVEEVWRSYFTTGKTPESVKLPWVESPGWLRPWDIHPPQSAILLKPTI
jgi:hypothetical protein